MDTVDPLDGSPVELEERFQVLYVPPFVRFLGRLDQLLAELSRAHEEVHVKLPAIHLGQRQLEGVRHFERRTSTLAVSRVSERESNENLSYRLEIVHFGEDAMQRGVADAGLAALRHSWKAICVRKVCQQHAVTQVEEVGPKSRSPRCNPRGLGKRLPPLV